jgi:hypothetical protein
MFHGLVPGSSYSCPDDPLGKLVISFSIRLLGVPIRFRPLGRPEVSGDRTPGRSGKGANPDPEARAVLLAGTRRATAISVVGVTPEPPRVCATLWRDEEEGPSGHCNRAELDHLGPGPESSQVPPPPESTFVGLGTACNSG